jgi:hypothetical protein
MVWTAGRVHDQCHSNVCSTLTPPPHTHREGKKGTAFHTHYFLCGNTPPKRCHKCALMISFVGVPSPMSIRSTHSNLAFNFRELLICSLLFDHFADYSPETSARELARTLLTQLLCFDSRTAKHARMRRDSFILLRPVHWQ